MTTLFGVAGFLVYERVNGTSRRLAVMPMRNSTILSGNFAGRFTLGAVQMILMVGFGALVLSVPYGNDPLALAVMLITFGLAGTAFGIMLGTFSRTMSQAGGLSILFAMLFAALGGCWWPLEITPPIYQTLVKVLPSTWAMLGLTDIIVYGKGLSDVWLNAVVLLVFAAIYFVIGVRRMRLDWKWISDLHTQDCDGGYTLDLGVPIVNFLLRLSWQSEDEARPDHLLAFYLNDECFMIPIRSLLQNSSRAGRWSRRVSDKSG